MEGLTESESSHRWNNTAMQTSSTEVLIPKIPHYYTKPKQRCYWPWCMLRTFHQHDDDVVCDGGWKPGVCSVCLLLWRLLDGWMMGFCCPEDDEYCTYFLLSFLSRLHKKVVRLFHWLANCNTHNKYHPRSSNRWLEWVGASVCYSEATEGDTWKYKKYLVLWLWGGPGNDGNDKQRQGQRFSLSDFSSTKEVLRRQEWSITTYCRFTPPYLGRENASWQQVTMIFLQPHAKIWRHDKDNDRDFYRTRLTLQYMERPKERNHLEEEEQEEYSRRTQFRIYPLSLDWESFFVWCLTFSSPNPNSKYVQPKPRRNACRNDWSTKLLTWMLCYDNQASSRDWPCRRLMPDWISFN